MYNYPPELTTAESTILDKGVSIERLKAFKAQVAVIHFESSIAKRMPGSSQEVLETAMRLSIETAEGFDPEIMTLIRDFADSYHRWVAKNEAIVMADFFERMLRDSLPHLNAGEFTHIYKKIITAIAQLTNPEHAKKFYGEIMRIMGPPTPQDLPAEEIHMVLNALISNLCRSTDSETNAPIFIRPDVISAWICIDTILANILFPEEFITEKGSSLPKTAMGYPLSIFKDLVEATQNRDTRALRQALTNPLLRQIVSAGAILRNLDMIENEIN